ncbi:hypothetical protein Vadar_026837 [Vaccinium darrowii]|uniref:Uncharacterized protein n=1 Tax=Vaccinium darrowii TaxID=229202 RepID=A0ACB7Y944_9ERIC|nr:hypothetical protein Vadar_026837 [Vaccinium darrowii]
MAAYYPGLSNQRDILPVPYLRDQKLDPGPEQPYAQSNLMYMNQYTSAASFPELFSGGSPSLYDPSARDELEFMPPASERTAGQAIDVIKYADSDNSYNTIKFGDLTSPYGAMGSNDMHFSQHLCEPSGGGVGPNCNSKYLKAAQQLLNEVVNVQAAMKQFETNKHNDSFDTKTNPNDPHEPMTNCSSEISPSERQDMQNKLSKLLSMSDEVDTRYRQYYNQMQMLVSSFEMVSGHGAAKPYTILALKTISRHFRSLHDAINGQIKVIQEKLGDHDSAPRGLPRLRFVEQKLRQQKQFGVMRHSWRPQRGLPESSVSILRAWLFEHFLHPYPKESEKVTLAKKTGLSRRQVANWFINARVRLWKPMVEEMYKEEFSEVDFKSSPELLLTTDKSWPPEDMGEELRDFVI